MKTLLLRLEPDMQLLDLLQLLQAALYSLSEVEIASKVVCFWSDVRLLALQICLIMDEVDGMSAGDRGGVADLINTIKGSKVPIICICNDKYSQKLKSLRSYTVELDFRCAAVSFWLPQPTIDVLATSCLVHSFIHDTPGSDLLVSDTVPGVSANVTC